MDSKNIFIWISDFYSIFYIFLMNLSIQSEQKQENELLAPNIVMRIRQIGPRCISIPWVCTWAYVSARHFNPPDRAILLNQLNGISRRRRLTHAAAPPACTFIAFATVWFYRTTCNFFVRNWFIYSFNYNINNVVERPLNVINK